MNIDITDLTSTEIIQILTNYPEGQLVITKQERIFWNSASYKPVNKAAASFDPRQPPKGDGGDIGQRFERMADTLGRLVC